MTSAGRVLLISKGAWVSGTSYSPLDFVYDLGSTYVCKSAVSGSTHPGSDTTHWQLMATGFDPDLLVQDIENESQKISSAAAVYGESQALRGDFAYIEASTTATKNYSIGELLVLDGQLYEVTQAIVTNETLAVGTNIAATSVASKLNSLNGLLNFTDTGAIDTFTIESGASAVGTVANPIRYALNTNKNAGKIYGFLRINSLVGTGGRITLDTGISVAATGSAYVLHGIFGQAYYSGEWHPLTNPYITVAANGDVGLSFIASNSAVTYDAIIVTLPACIYIFKDFGDPEDEEE